MVQFNRKLEKLTKSWQMVKVVNKYKSRYDVYIGRPSKWANWFYIGRDGTRLQVIEKYKSWLIDEVYLYKSITHRDIMQLEGKILGCFCAPKPCHGDVLKWAVKMIKKHGTLLPVELGI